MPVAELDRATAARPRAAPAVVRERALDRASSSAGAPTGHCRRWSAASDAAIGALGWPDIEQALAAHPRIGDRPAGPAGGDREAAWSRQEQSGTRDAPADVQAELRAGNVAYEDRFGHVFLICATGQSAARCWPRCRPGSATTPRPSARSSGTS